MSTWRNWAGTESATGVELLRPSSVDEVAAMVKTAAEQGKQLKAVGSGHSFTGCSVPEQVMVRLDGLASITSADQASGRVTLGAGTGLAKLNAGLASFDLAMANLGDIDKQTIAGAISTGTHGTGAKLGGLATQIVGLELVTADGSVLHCSAEENPDVFNAARVSIGSLGVITALTLQTVPAYLLRAQEMPLPLDDVLAGFDELADGNDHFEFYWFPHTGLALTKRNNRVADGVGASPVSRLRGWVDDELLSNRVFELTNRLVTRRPGLTPRINQLASRALSAREYVDSSYKVFCSERNVVFRESEYAVPREHVVEVVQQLRAWVERSGERLPFPIEVRVAAADDIWLSTAYGRDTGYIAIHQYHRLAHDKYFDAFEQIAGAFGGRPHWGKLHTLGASDFRERYPRFDDFLAVRDRLDPQRAFANPYTRQVFGS
ncbi:D-arabinono-1,4-lactone oxidase [Streptomyces sp. SID13031]|uniref:D-arabinono-1,4-lactone oxidase n=1 Tax=Streptomyces sp. SID13031 TaxID=2706046 RepID=UPI0013C7364C|nr:D-arabinono-1,4-lactone oxidase [Streptomyces sp. SID13031]NEA31312.1 FAD-binding protein [Streptomyces sp. SID13031]